MVVYMTSSRELWFREFSLRKFRKFFLFQNLTKWNFQNFLCCRFVHIDDGIDRRSKKWNLDQNVDCWRNSLPVPDIPLDCQHCADDFSSDRVSDLRNLCWQQQLWLEIYFDRFGSSFAAWTCCDALRTLHIGHDRFITQCDIFLNTIDFPFHKLEWWVTVNISIDWKLNIHSFRSILAAGRCRHGIQIHRLSLTFHDAIEKLHQHLIHRPEVLESIDLFGILRACRLGDRRVNRMLLVVARRHAEEEIKIKHSNFISQKRNTEIDISRAPINVVEHEEADCTKKRLGCYAPSVS